MVVNNNKRYLLFFYFFVFTFLVENLTDEEVGGGETDGSVAPSVDPVVEVVLATINYEHSVELCS